MSSIFEKTFSLRIPYNAECIEDLQQIMGRSYDKKTGETSFPAVEIFDVADTIAPYFSNLAERLKTSARFEKERDMAKDAIHMIYLSRAKKARFKPKCPEDCKPFPFQAAGVYYATYESRNNVLIADSMGLGKSCQAVMVANELGARRALFIGPNSAKINWQREILKWSTETQDVSVIEGSSKPGELKEHDYVSINYDILAKHEETLMSVDWDMIVCDEAHMMKNKEAKRTQAATNLCSKAGYVALLTGSPIVNRPYELWNLVNTLNPIYWRNWWDFANYYCDAKRNPYTGIFEYKGAKHMAELQDKLRMTVMLRRLKKDVLKDLPPKTRQIVEIPATRKFSTLLAAQEKYVGKLRKVIDLTEDIKKTDDPEEQEAKFRERVKRSGHMSPAEFEDMAKLRRLTALAKAPEVAEFAEGILESKPKIGIYAYHKDVQKFFIDHFKKKAVHIVAGMTAGQRQLAVDRFQTDPKISVFVGSIMAAGTAITLTAADVCIMTEVHVVPGINSQVEDRFHRIGTVNPVLIYYTMLQNSVDYYLANMFISKQEIIEKALDTKTSMVSKKRRFR